MSHPLAWNTDNLFHVKTSVGAARFAVYSFKDIFKFSGTFLGKIYYKRGIPLAARPRLRRCLVVHFVLKWSVLKLQNQLWAAGGKARGLCGQLCSTAIQCRDNVMIQGGRETRFRKWIGQLNTNCGREAFPLAESLFDCCFCSVSVWGQQGGEQQWSNERNSVPLNYPIKSAFYLSVPTHPVQEQSHTHTHR